MVTVGLIESEIAANSKPDLKMLQLTEPAGQKQGGEGVGKRTGA